MTSGLDRQSRIATRIADGDRAGCGQDVRVKDMIVREGGKHRPVRRMHPAPLQAADRQHRRLCIQGLCRQPSQPQQPCLTRGVEQLHSGHALFPRHHL